MWKSRIISVILLCLLASTAWPQATVTNLTPPKMQFLDNNGKPLAGGFVYFCVTLLTCPGNPLNTYTDYTGGVANSNPVVLDAGGFASVWLVQNSTYRIVVQNSNHVQQYQLDGIVGFAASTSIFNQNTVTVPFSATPIFTSLAQNQLFKLTLTANVTSSTLIMTGVVAPAIVTFEINQDGVGLHSFVWPTNVIGGTPIINLYIANTGIAQSFFWDGVNAVAMGPNYDSATGFFDVSTSTFGANTNRITNEAFVRQALQGSGVPGSLVFDGGAGTGATGSFDASSTDGFGEITVNTGTTPAFNNSIVHWTLSRSYSHQFCQVTDQNNTNMDKIVVGMFPQLGNQINLFNNTATALTAGVSYHFMYHCDLLP